MAPFGILTIPTGTDFDMFSVHHCISCSKTNRSGISLHWPITNILAYRMVYRGRIKAERWGPIENERKAECIA